MARSQKSAERRTKPEDIWRYGYRYAKRGREYDTVPLTEDDLLHPQEGDHVVTNDYHVTDVGYLLSVFRSQTKNSQRLRVFAKHIIDFQQGGVQPLAPDLTVLDGEPLEWDRCKSTFPVAKMKARVLFVIELTSPSTRRKDLRDKAGLYYRAGVPLYVVIDAPYGGGRKPRGVLPFQAGPKSYELLPVDKDGRYWLDAVGLSIGIVDEHVACFDKKSALIGDYSDIAAQFKQAKAGVGAERARANEAEARADEAAAQADAAAAQADAAAAQADAAEAQADAATAQADAAEAQADAAEARVRELEAQLKKPKRRKSP